MSLSLVRVDGMGNLSRNLKTRLLYSVADSCTGTAVFDTYPYSPPPRFLGIYMYITIFEQKISLIWKIFKVNTMVSR